MAPGPHRQVHLNAMEDAREISARSVVVLAFVLLCYVAEIVVASLCLKKGWDSECDKPLRVWIIVSPAGS
jgi:hypothetical protein